jgi:DNA repair protein RadA/Sms
MHYYPKQNRFGSSHEIGVFEMTALGLEEVANPSLLFTSTALDSADSSSNGTDDDDELEPNALPDGTAVLVAMEGTRPILCELQVWAHIHTYTYHLMNTHVRVLLQECW